MCVLLQDSVHLTFDTLLQRSSESIRKHIVDPSQLVASDTPIVGKSSVSQLTTKENDIPGTPTSAASAAVASRSLAELQTQFDELKRRNAALELEVASLTDQARTLTEDNNDLQQQLLEEQSNSKKLGFLYKMAKLDIEDYQAQLDQLQQQSKILQRLKREAAQEMR
jgi:FtsZ-binding cell division protein ZapB